MRYCGYEFMKSAGLWIPVKSYALTRFCQPGIVELVAAERIDSGAAVYIDANGSARQVEREDIDDHRRAFQLRAQYFGLMRFDAPYPPYLCAPTPKRRTPDGPLSDEFMHVPYDLHTDFRIDDSEFGTGWKWPT